MNVFQLFSLSFEALRERRVRTSLTILMVVMGASLIVSLNGVGNGFTNFIDSQFSALGANTLILTPSGDNLELDNSVSDRISRFEGVSEVIPFFQQISPIEISKGETQTLIISGLDQSKLELLFPTLSLKIGSFISESDTIGILLGNEAARSLGELEESAGIGQTVKITYQKYEEVKPTVTKRTFIIRGILEYVGSGIIPLDQMVFISSVSAKSFFDRGMNYDGYYIILENTEFIEVVRETLSEVYGTDITIVSPQMIANTIQQVTSGVYLFINVVAMVSLLVASVGIITTIQTSMMERIREIGLLKALGFNRTLILGLFLSEAMIIGILGGFIGVVFGVLLSHGMSALLSRGLQIEIFSLDIIPAFDLTTMFLTWLLCSVLSVVSGFYPSWRASNLNPVEALRHE